MIHIPKYGEIHVPIKVKACLRGFFRLEAVGLDGRKRLLAEFPNLITTLGGNMLGSSATVLGSCSVGSGNATPTLADTTLQSLVASTTATISTNRTVQSSPPYYGTTTIVYNFAIGDATGNLSEVGVGLNDTNLFSRALILDGFGSPTTITVLSSEALYVTYILNQYVPDTDVTGTVDISGTPYTYTLRAMDADQVAWAYLSGDDPTLNTAAVYSGAIGSVTSQPSGFLGSSDSNVTDSYSADTFLRTATATWGLTAGIGTILSAGVTFGGSNSRGQYQVQFGTGVVKDGSQVLTLSFQTAWAINTP